MARIDRSRAEADPHAAPAAGPLEHAHPPAAREAAAPDLVHAADPGAGAADAMRRLQRRLAESEARFQNIIARTTDGIVVVGRDGRIRFVNPAAERLFGRRTADLLGEEFGAPLIAGETTELDIVRRDGGPPTIVELRTTATQWDGETAQLLSLRDITDRKKSERRARRLLLEKAARRHAEAKDRRSRFLSEASAALDSSLDLGATLAELAQLMVPRVADWCVIGLLDDGAMRAVAVAHAEPEQQALLAELKQAAALAGGAAALLHADEPRLLNELSGDRIRQLFGDDALAALLERVGTRALIVVPLRLRERRLGTLAVGCARASFDPDDAELVEEVAARAARAIDNARLYRAALVASQAKSDFLSIVSHELRTPLNAIMGYTEMLLGGLVGDITAAQRERLERVDACAHHLLQIIEEILAHAKLEGGHDQPRPQPFRLGELVSSVVAVAEPLVRAKSLAFELDVSDPQARCITDVGKLRQIILNLLSNAVKFTEHGTVTLRAAVAGDQLVFAVADTGIGIAAEHRAAIFEPFWQVEQPLRRHAGGTGLGLSVSRRLVEMLSGTIEIESEPGVGSTFTVRLPAGRDTTSPAGASRPR